MVAMADFGWVCMLELVVEFGLLLGYLNQLHDIGFIPSPTVHRVFGYVLDSRFWTDIWCANISLIYSFHILFALTNNCQVLVRDFWSIQGLKHFFVIR